MNTVDAVLHWWPLYTAFLAAVVFGLRQEGRIDKLEQADNFNSGLNTERTERIEQAVIRLEAKVDTLLTQKHAR